MTTLGEVSKILSGSTPSTKEGSYWDGEIPWITPKDLSGYSSVYISRGERNISDEGLKNSSAQMLPKNTILFSSRAPIGYVVIAKNEVATNQGFKNVICDEKESHFMFFYYWLIKNTEYIESLSSGSTFSEASATVVRNLVVELPPLPEQRAIAAVLSSLDDKIELLREQNKTLEATAQAIFKEWFVNFNFPGASGKMIDSELGKIPEGWRVGKLGDVVDICGGTTPSTENSDFWNGNISWTSPKDLSGSNDVFLLKTEKKITKEGLNKISSGLLPVGSLLLSSRAPIGYLAISNIEVAINQGYIAFFPNQYLSNQFIFLWLKLNMDTVIGSANGSTFLEISKSSFRNIDCVVPESITLEKFNDSMNPLFKKMLNNSLQFQTLSTLRDTLLPKLMKGEVRVEGFKK